LHAQDRKNYQNQHFTSNHSQFKQTLAFVAKGATLKLADCSAGATLTMVFVAKGTTQKRCRQSAQNHQFYSMALVA
jgi:hypothetical protein